MGEVRVHLDHELGAGRPGRGRSRRGRPGRGRSWPAGAAPRRPRARAASESAIGAGAVGRVVVDDQDPVIAWHGALELGRRRADDPVEIHGLVVGRDDQPDALVPSARERSGPGVPWHDACPHAEPRHGGMHPAGRPSWMHRRHADASGHSASAAGPPARPHAASRRVPGSAAIHRRRRRRRRAGRAGRLALALIAGLIAGARAGRSARHTTARRPRRVLLQRIRRWPAAARARSRPPSSGDENAAITRTLGLHAVCADRRRPAPRDRADVRRRPRPVHAAAAARCSSATHVPATFFEVGVAEQYFHAATAAIVAARLSDRRPHRDPRADVEAVAEDSAAAAASADGGDRRLRRAVPAPVPAALRPLERDHAGAAEEVQDADGPVDGRHQRLRAARRRARSSIGPWHGAKPGAIILHARRRRQPHRDDRRAAEDHQGPARHAATSWSRCRRLLLDNPAPKDQDVASPGGAGGAAGLRAPRVAAASAARKRRGSSSARAPARSARRRGRAGCRRTRSSPR